MAFCNPLFRHSLHRAGWRIFTASLTIGLAMLLAVQPSLAQSINIIRDTEIERWLYKHERPLLKAAGMDPDSVHIHIVQDPSLNAFAAQSPIAGNSEDIFVNTGLFFHLKTPNEVIGVLAHETGHIAGGDALRSGVAMNKAGIPMLIGLAVGVAAMAAGAGEAGIGAMMLGQQAGMAQYLKFSVAQEGTADQRGQKYLRATKQSGMGMLDVFTRMANENAMSMYYNKEFISDHPADRERVDMMRQIAEASPYANVKDSPEAMHEFRMIQAKLTGYLSDPDQVLIRFPVSDTSDEALYARTIAYFRKPDLQKALSEINTLIKRHPQNPYFWEVLGQINVEMSQPQKGIGPYQKSVALMPDAPLLRIALAAAQLATENPALAKPAIANLKIALQQENDNAFGWYEAALAYSLEGNNAMADLATAERYYTTGAMGPAARFATRAAHKLPQGTTDWQRANDIMSIATREAKEQRR
ncbi:MAG TPA: M48 family metalloprotease [Rhizomicrobium sp.]|nr:M48 family metalloprotease [Rhizomicrobium sp.]